MIRHFTIFGIIGALVLTLFIQHDRLKKAEADRDIYRGNTTSLLQKIETYEVADSLHAATVGALQLKLSEFEYYRAADAELIRQLQVKNRSLQSTTTTQTEIINQLRGMVRDSFIYLPGDSIITILKCVDIRDKWYTFNGCMTPAGEFSGTFINRDSLLIAATVEYKRFLGFLWHTRKIKNRKVDAVSRNPNTHILGIEFVDIRR